MQLKTEQHNFNNFIKFTLLGFNAFYDEMGLQQKSWNEKEMQNTFDDNYGNTYTFFMNHLSIKHKIELPDVYATFVPAFSNVINPNFESEKRK